MIYDCDDHDVGSLYCAFKKRYVLQLIFCLSWLYPIYVWNNSLTLSSKSQFAARFKPSARFIHVKTKRYMPYHRNVIYNPSNIQLQKTRSQAKLN